MRLISGRNTIRTSGCLGASSRGGASAFSRHLQVVELSARRRDHAACDAFPGPPLAHGRNEPRARQLANGRIGLQPADDASRQRLDGAIVDGEREQRRDPLGHRLRERIADLGESGVRRADRQCAARRGLCGDHAEGLRERARYDHRLARRQQIGELLVIQPAGQHDAILQSRRCGEIALQRISVQPVEEGQQMRQRAGLGGLVLQRAPGPRDPLGLLDVAGRQCGTQPLKALAIGAEADDHQPRGRHALEHQRPGGQQQVDALADDQLAHERDQTVVGEIQTRERVAGGALVAREGVRDRRCAGVARFGLQSGDERAQSRRGGRPLARHEALDIHARRAEASPALHVGVIERSPQAGRGVVRTDEHAARLRETLAGEREEALGIGLDRVLERAAVNLHGIRHAAAERARQYRRAHHQVVCQRHLRRCAGDDLADGRDVRLDVMGDLAIAALGERARLDALVAIRHVHRQKIADVRPVDRAAARALAPAVPHCAHPQRALVPVADRIDEGVLLGVAVLAEQVHFVPLAHERRRQARVVDVRSGPAEQVAVEDEDAHQREPSARPSRFRLVLSGAPIEFCA
jgi:hypothetical protein